MAKVMMKVKGFRLQIFEGLDFRVQGFGFEGCVVVTTSQRFSRFMNLEGARCWK